LVEPVLSSLPHEHLITDSVKYFGCVSFFILNTIAQAENKVKFSKCTKVKPWCMVPVDNFIRQSRQQSVTIQTYRLIINYKIKKMQNMKKFLLSVFALFFVLSAVYSVTNMANAGFLDFLFGSDGSRSVAASSSTGSGEYKLKIRLSYSGKSGTVTSDDGTVSCSKKCTLYYSNGETITLSVTANSGYSFSKWSGSGCEGTGTCQVEMSKSRSVKAVFKKDKSSSATTDDGKVRLTVERASSEYGGSVDISAKYTSTGGREYMGEEEYFTGTCQLTDTTKSSESCVNELSTSDSNVWLTPISSEGAIFSKWSGCDNTSDEKCYLSVSGKSTTVKVYFKAATATVEKKITIYSYTDGSSSSGAGGKVEVKKDGVSKGTCSSKCSTEYAEDTELKLTATANEGYNFEKWGDSCSGSSSECSVTLSGDKTVKAYFTKISDSTTTPGSTVSNVTMRVSGAKTTDSNNETYGINKGDDLTVFWDAQYVSECTLYGGYDGYVAQSIITDNASDDKNTAVGFISGEKTLDDIKKDAEFSLLCGSIGEKSVGYDFKVTVIADTTGTQATSNSSATNITSTSATLNGTVNPAGGEITYEFKYGVGSDYSKFTKTGGKTVSGSGEQSVSVDITGLTAGTTYNYYISAYDSTTREYLEKNTDANHKDNWQSFTTGNQ